MITNVGSRLTTLFSRLVSSSYAISHINSQIKFLTLKDGVNRKKIYNVLFDMCLGISFLLLIGSEVIVNTMLSYTLVARTKVKYSLQSLITWLMGAPAGLKLNEELSSFLGNFFLYHVYIWLAYLSIIEDLLPVVINGLAYSSCFGLTMFLSLTNDFINMLTFHIYCFYVYAAKLYRLQLCGLTSLSRLFMGKKWNVLRHRVDSITYEADQLILGTIIFTILLFLFPTTIMYYIVFTSTRLLVLVIQTFIRILVVYLAKIPVYDVTWGIKEKDKGGINSTKSDNVGKTHLGNMKDFLYKLLAGKIIRPWKENG